MNKLTATVNPTSITPRLAMTEDETDDFEANVLAAERLAAMVAGYGQPLTLRAVQGLVGRMSFERLATILVIGHRSGFLRLSRCDLPQVNGTPAETGEITFLGAAYHRVGAA